MLGALHEFLIHFLKMTETVFRSLEKVVGYLCWAGKISQSF